MWQSHILLFFLFFPLFLHSLAPQTSSNPGQWRQRGRQEPESQKDMNLPLRLEELLSQESGASPIAFHFPLLFCCLALMWAWLWEVYGRMGLMKPQLSAGRLKKGSPRNPEDCRWMRSLGKWPLKIAHRLLSWLPSCACLCMILNGTLRTKLWDRPPPSPKLDTAWDSYGTHSVWLQRLCTLNWNWKCRLQKDGQNLKCEPSWVNYWLK